MCLQLLEHGYSLFYVTCQKPQMEASEKKKRRSRSDGIQGHNLYRCTFIGEYFALLGQERLSVHLASF